MTYWERVRRETRCGSCGRVVPVGEPVRMFDLGPHVTRHKVRCVACADDAVPELPPLTTVTTERKTPIIAMRRLGFLPLDEREPGQEG
jgi:hypothetical protein